MADHRGDLFFEIKRLILGSSSGKALGHCGPRAFVLENVGGLISHGKGAKRLSKLHAGALRVIGPTMQHLEEELEAMTDYRILWKELDSSWFASPQIRKRVFIVGVHKDIASSLDPFPFPVGTEPSCTIRSILEMDDYPGLALNERQDSNIRKDMLQRKKTFI